MIGIFDSGLGGLTIFREIEKRLPQYDYIYLGDNARAPYGDHSEETILRYTTEAVAYLFHQGCVLVLLACNTASAEALRSIQQNWLTKQGSGRNVLGVIQPLAEEAVRVTKGIVGVMATRSTANSHAYRREIHKLNKKITVFEQPCRLLVPLIEEGLEDKPEARRILKRYLRPIKAANADTVILGCTHYGIIAASVKRYLGKNAQVLDSGKIVAEKFADYLQRHPEYEQQLSRKGMRSFVMTEQTDTVDSLVKKFLGRNAAVTLVTLPGLE